MSNNAFWPRGSYINNRVCCCNTSQIEAFVVIGVTAILTSILWRSCILAPIKLVAVFLHEFSHASATWLTCGKVLKMEVNEDFGGVTRSQGKAIPKRTKAKNVDDATKGLFMLVICFQQLVKVTCFVYFNRRIRKLLHRLHNDFELINDDERNYV